MRKLQYLHRVPSHGKASYLLKEVHARVCVCVCFVDVWALDARGHSRLPDWCLAWLPQPPAGAMGRG